MCSFLWLCLNYFFSSGLERVHLDFFWLFLFCLVCFDIYPICILWDPRTCGIGSVINFWKIHSHYCFKYFFSSLVLPCRIPSVVSLLILSQSSWMLFSFFLHFTLFFSLCFTQSNLWTYFQVYWLILQLCAHQIYYSSLLNSNILSWSFLLVFISLWKLPTWSSITVHFFY